MRGGQCCSEDFGSRRKLRTASAGSDLVGRRNPNLVLVDYRLPEMVGTKFARALRPGGVDAPVVPVRATPERVLNDSADPGALP